MNLTPTEAVSYFGELRSNLNNHPLKKGVRRVIFPPAYCLNSEVQRAALDCQVELGAQNVHWEEKGAFTAEISPTALLAMGIQWALVGHSERRQYFGETDETAARRFKRAAETGLNVMYCIGETLSEREKGQTGAVLDRQLGPFLGVLRGLLEQNAHVWPDQKMWCLAYEPVWAIGTGKTATAVEAEQAHDHIRKAIEKSLGAKIANKMPILYGGSVTPDNVTGLIAEADVDGALVGGASLNSVGFARILASAK